MRFWRFGGASRGDAEAMIGAVERGDAEEVRRFVDASPRLVDASWASSGRSPLSEALLRGHEEIALYLIDHGADLRGAGRHGTLLHLAACRGLARAAEALINRGGDVNAESPDKDTPLHHAASGGHVETALLLARNGADLNARDGDGLPAVQRAAHQSHADLVRELVDLGAEHSSLHTAALLGDLALAQESLSGGADIDARGPLGMTPLHWAALGRSESASVAELLVSRGADLNAADVNGSTALTAAASLGNMAVAEALLDIATSSHDRDKAFVRAVSEGHTALAELLLKRGADVNAVDSSGMGMIRLASAAGATDLLRLAFDWGAKLADRTEFSPLHFAAYNDRREIAQLLIEHGANVDAKDKGGRTPLHEAAQMNHAAMIELLLSAGASADLPDNDGGTPLQVARAKHSEKAIRLLQGVAD